MAFAATLILFIICWPLAFAMSKVFGKFAIVITIGVVMTLFVSENIRLFGWVLTLMKGGLIEGHLRAWFGISFENALYNVPVIIFGLVYVYVPFMLFPLAQGIAMVPDDARQAAADSGRQPLADLEGNRPPAIGARHCRRLFAVLRALSAGALAEIEIAGRSGRDRHRRTRSKPPSPIPRTGHSAPALQWFSF